MHIKTIRENGRYTIHYDISGTGDRFPENVRKEFAAALHHRLRKIDSTVPMYQNKVWSPRRCRLSLPLGEIILKRKGDIQPAVDILKDLLRKLNVSLYNNGQNICQ